MVEAKDFKAALGAFASGVTVVTVSSDEGDHGMTASAFSSLSLDPPLVLVCIQNGNRSYDLIDRKGSFAVSILSRAQESLSNRFAGGFVDESGQWHAWPEDRDKFSDLTFERGETSEAPMLDGALAHLDCSLEAILPGGDHGIFVGRVESVRIGDQTEPLLYHRGRYGDFS